MEGIYNRDLGKIENQNRAEKHCYSENILISATKYLRLSFQTSLPIVFTSRRGGRIFLPTLTPGIF